MLRKINIGKPVNSTELNTSEKAKDIVKSGTNDIATIPNTSPTHKDIEKILKGSGAAARLFEEFMRLEVAKMLQEQNSNGSTP